MPTLNVELGELLRIVGGDITTEKLFHAISQLKGEIKESDQAGLNIELCPDRPDLLSPYGLARALRSYLEIEIGLPECTKVRIEPVVELEIKQANVRPMVGCVIAKHVELNFRSIKNLMGLQELMHITIGRNRRKMAVGIHDFDRIVPPLTYTDAPLDTKLVPLDLPEEMSLRDVFDRHEKGKAYRHLLEGYAKVPVFIDSLGVFSFPPVINSERTRVTERTRNLFVEMTGMDARAIAWAISIISADLVDMGAKLEGIIIRSGAKRTICPELAPRTVVLDIGYAEKTIGVKLTEEEVMGALVRMGHEVASIRENVASVRIPPYRSDVLHQIDLIEDLAIGYGYNRLTPELPSIPSVGRSSPERVGESRVKMTLLGLSYQEVLTFTLSNKKLQCESMGVQDFDRMVEIENPVTEDLSCLRIWILPHLLNFLRFNKHVKYPHRIFELGYVFEVEGTQAQTHRSIAAATIGADITFNDARAVVEALGKTMGWETTLVQDKHPSFIEGRSASILSDNMRIGLVGEVHPQVLNNFELELPTAAFEITLSSQLHYADQDKG